MSTNLIGGSANQCYILSKFDAIIWNKSFEDKGEPILYILHLPEYDSDLVRDFDWVDEGEDTKEIWGHDTMLLFGHYGFSPCSKNNFSTMNPC